jgi:hypothetical protein
MKIKRNELFQPITITIETEQEAMALFTVANYAPVAAWLTQNGIDTNYLRNGLAVSGGQNMLHSLHAGVTTHVKDNK